MPCNCNTMYHTYGCDSEVGLWARILNWVTCTTYVSETWIQVAMLDMEPYIMGPVPGYLQFKHSPIP